MSDADRAFARAEERIAEAIAEGATKLYLSGDDFADLIKLPTRISGFTGLKILDLSGSQVAELTPLSGLTGLEAVGLDTTLVSDLTPLTGNTALNWLDLTRTQVTDLNPLAEMAGLRMLFLTNTQISDLTPLAGKVELRSLDLRNTKVSDLAPLASNAGLRFLYLRNTQVADLTPLLGLAALEKLYLDKTQVTDLAPLSGLGALTGLDLNDTSVADLTPLAKLTGLQALSLNKTKVADLRPLSGLSNLLQPGERRFLNGLWFETCPATARDQELKRLSEIEDHHDRTERTLAYLQRLPPWPEPLPWLPSEGDRNTPLSDPPEVEGLPEVRVTAEGLEVLPGIATAEDLADPIRARLYEQLEPALDTLLRQGNRYPEVADAAQAMRDLVSVPFAEADILGLHFQICALSDVRTEDASRREIERMDADCRIALNTVLRMGPPITIGHPDVALVEERNAAFINVRVSETEAESERRLATTIAQHSVPANEAARMLSAALEHSATEGKLAQPRRVFLTKVVLGVGAVALSGAGAMSAGALGHLGAESAEWALKWISANRDAISTAARGWGQEASDWVRDMLEVLLRT